DAKQTARHGDDHVKDERASVGKRAGIVQRHGVRTLEEFVTEAALSRARLRGNENDSRSTGLRLAPSPLQQRQLALTADQSPQATRPGTLEAGPDTAPAPQLRHRPQE